MNKHDPSTKVKFKFEGRIVTTDYFESPFHADKWAKENVEGKYQLKQ